MNEVLVYMEIMVAFTVLVSFVCGVFSYVVIKPLNTAITQLNSAVGELDKVVKSIDAREHEFDKRLTLVENSVKAFHRRLDALVDFCRDTHRSDVPDDVYRMMAGVARTSQHVPSRGAAAIRHNDPQPFPHPVLDGDEFNED